FFFQAEDGIRDFHVTGVQTCALPIYKPFEGLHAEHLHQIDALANIGQSVFGNSARFEAWLRAPKTIMGNAVGFEALRSFSGAQLLVDELGRMMHGIYS